VAVTVNGVTVSAAIGADGRFAAVIPTGGFSTAGSPYVVAISYAGDANFDGATASSSLGVVDTTAPAITGAFAAPASLLPPSNLFWPVYVGYTATDASGTASCGISVTSNDPTARDPRTLADVDWLVVGPHLALLRAERVAPGAATRLYLITVSCADAAGNRSSAYVVVPVARP